jgi:hypothetical protein
MLGLERTFRFPNRETETLLILQIAHIQPRDEHHLWLLLRPHAIHATLGALGHCSRCFTWTSPAASMNDHRQLTGLLKEPCRPGREIQSMWMRLAWCILFRWAADLAADLALPLRSGRAQWASQRAQVTLSEWHRDAQWAKSGMGWALKRKGKAKTCQTLSCLYARRMGWIITLLHRYINV